MCGIVAITSKGGGGGGLALALVERLSRLEYRGYDSAGIALVLEGANASQSIYRARAAVASRSLDELKKHLDSAPAGLAAATTGIGHTRWATHGRPSEQNAHPHLGCATAPPGQAGQAGQAGKAGEAGAPRAYPEVAIVHNGIVENWRELAGELERKGHELSSETDSEVVAHLLEEELALTSSSSVAPAPPAPSSPPATLSPLAVALGRVAQRLAGSYAIAAVAAGFPTIAIARRLSPIVIGISGDAGGGTGTVMAASDIPALIGMADRCFVLEDDEVAELNGTAGGFVVAGLDGEPRDPVEITVRWDMEQARKGGYADFMGKELHEQPQAISDTLRGRFNTPEGMALDEMRLSEDELREVDKIFVAACGSSYYASLVGKSALEHWAGLPAEIEIASEFRYRDPILTGRSLVLGVSQSGETVDTLQAVRLARQGHAKVLAVSNVVDSSITRMADGVLYTRAGPEIAVAATKTFSTQVVAFSLLAMYLARLRGLLYPEEVTRLAGDLTGLPALVRAALDREDEVRKVAEELAERRDLFYIGRGAGYPVALEGALKMKEIAYLRAEAYPAGELKHGAIALIEPGTAVVAVATRGRLWEKMMSNISEVKSRGATVVAVVEEGDAETASYVDRSLYVPPSRPLLSAAVDVVPLQLLAYHVARARGCDVDRPRNLAKTVTVE